MACDYEAIRRHNERSYGTDIGRIGPMLLADRYDDRTHFIFELLQNAEDALGRRTSWSGPRSVRFHLTPHELRVSHSGKPFDEADVRGICGIAESTKDHTAIGRFGIGFKSVYAFTDRPAIHSGLEDFAIENFVWPVAARPIAREDDETVIVIPLKSTLVTAGAEITAALQRLGASSLLFLRQIEEIEWCVEHGPSGLYLRSQAAAPDSPVRRITVIGQEAGKTDIEENWLVFSKAVAKNDGAPAGHVELAFLVVRDEKSRREGVVPVSKSPLVVFFPTVVETHLGFFVQGPYRTTPSRDNVSRDDAWNQYCVQETSTLLREALRWLRDHELLDADAMRSLPLDRARFAEESMFAQLFDATKRSLSSEPLLPRFGGGHATATATRLARTQELRELFDAAQLASLLGEDGQVAWLSGDITQDRTPELRQYLMSELDIAEVTPETILPKLDAAFLEVQADTWIVQLYAFLNGQPAMRRRAEALPLIRLADGRHVAAYGNGQPQAFLPGTIVTGFPTVRADVCGTEEARAFLRALGLTEPDPVDDVVWNVLPKYHADELDVGDADYDGDIRRILMAFTIDSQGQKEKLLAALRETPFVMTVDAGDMTEIHSQPGGVYLATDRLKVLFAGVPGVLLVDDRYSSLRGEDVSQLLQACGAVRYLRPTEDKSLSRQEREELRRAAGHADTSGRSDQLVDWMLVGLEGVLNALPQLDVETRRSKARLLWDELAHLEERRGKSVYTGEYTWTHYGNYRAPFDAAFVRLLNGTEWIPNSAGNLERPEFVLFDSLGWKPHPFLLSKIRFRPPSMDQLARDAGFEPGLLDLLKRLGLTSASDLRARLGVLDEDTPGGGEAQGGVDDALKKLLGESPGPTPPVPDPSGQDPPPGSGGSGAGRRTREGSGGEGEHSGHAGGDGDNSGQAKGSGAIGGKRTPGSSGGRPFVSYVAAHPDPEASDPDGLDQAARMELESKAIDLILLREKAWHRTPTHNPGFDLFETGADGRPSRWCEVKAMTGSLDDRPVGLSRTQFECAREHGAAYWLYVVERAGTGMARIVRIQDPAGRAGTFTFDHGWLDVAEADGEQVGRED